MPSLWRVVLKILKSSHIAAGSRDASNESPAYWIRDRYEHNRNSFGHRLELGDQRIGGRYDEIRGLPTGR
jgi:hypothetical protein